MDTVKRTYGFLDGFCVAISDSDEEATRRLNVQDTQTARHDGCVCFHCRVRAACSELVEVLPRSSFSMQWSRQSREMLKGIISNKKLWPLHENKNSQLL